MGKPETSQQKNKNEEENLEIGQKETVQQTQQAPQQVQEPVSYTHLTLPTIYSV